MTILVRGHRLQKSLITLRTVFCATYPTPQDISAHDFDLAAPRHRFEHQSLRGPAVVEPSVSAARELKGRPPCPKTRHMKVPQRVHHLGRRTANPITMILRNFRIDSGQRARPIGSPDFHYIVQKRHSNRTETRRRNQHNGVRQKSRWTSDYRALHRT